MPSYVDEFYRAWNAARRVREDLLDGEVFGANYARTVFVANLAERALATAGPGEPVAVHRLRQLREWADELAATAAARRDDELSNQGAFGMQDAAPPVVVSRSVEAYELAHIFASRSALAVNFKNAAPENEPRVEVQRARLLAEIAEVRDVLGAGITSAAAAELDQTEARVGSMIFGPAKRQYRRVHLAGAPGLGKRA